MALKKAAERKLAEKKADDGPISVADILARRIAIIGNDKNDDDSSDSGDDWDDDDVSSVCVVVVFVFKIYFIYYSGIKYLVIVVVYSIKNKHKQLLCELYTIEIYNKTLIVILKNFFFSFLNIYFYWKSFKFNKPATDFG